LAILNIKCKESNILKINYKNKKIDIKVTKLPFLRDK